MPAGKTELRGAGYQTHRDASDPTADPPDPWEYVELPDDQDNAVTRIHVRNDDRGEWVHSPGDQVLQAELEVAASDSDIGADAENPITVEATVSYTEETSGSERAYDEMNPVTFGNVDDIVIITHQVEIPEVV